MDVNTCHKRMLNAAVIPLLFVLFGTALAEETFRLEKIEPINSGSRFRVMVECSGHAPYLDRYEADPPTLVFYLRDTKLVAAKTDFQLSRGLVQAIHARQWRKAPPVVQIEITFRREVRYKITESISGLYLIDVFEPEREADGGNGLRDFEAHARNTGRREVSESVTLNQKAGAQPPAILADTAPISLDVKSADITNVLRLLAKQTGLNIVASKDVTGQVTVSLSNVTLKQALELVVKANGYEYVTQGEVILVKPPEKLQVQELETKVYRLKYIDANNLRTTVAQLLSPQAKVQVFYPNFRPNVQAQQGQPQTATKRSSILVVTDFPANIQQLDAMVAALDVPTPQIMIEAKLIEIAPQKSENIGINWAKSINAQIFREVLLPSGNTFRNSVEVPLAGGSISYGTLNFDQYNAVINFLNSHTNSKLVSNPRVLTMDNQEAVISVGTTVPIPQINRGVGGQGDIVTFSYRDVNIALRVTPHVSDDETITLYVNPDVEEIIGEVVAGENRAPITSKRQVETVVNLKSNETMVIGGLIRENTVETVDKVWLLGDIPLLGNLFRNKDKTRRQTDLLIFITPRILESP